MKSSMHDKVEGKFHRVKGNIKEVAGNLGNNPELESKGKFEKTAGKIQEKVGQAKKLIGK